MELDEELNDWDRNLVLLDSSHMIQKTTALTTLATFFAQVKKEEQEEVDVAPFIAILKRYLIEPEEHHRASHEQVVETLSHIISIRENGHIDTPAHVVDNTEWFHQICATLTQSSKTLKQQEESEIPVDSHDFVLTSDQITECVYPLVFQYAQLQSSSAPDAIDLLISCISRMDSGIIESQMLPYALEKGDMSQPMENRIACCRLIGAIAAYGQLDSTVFATQCFDKVQRSFSWDDECNEMN